MISEEENQNEKDLFLKNYFPCSTSYLSMEELERKIPSYRYLNDELKILEDTSPESTMKHVMSKKKLLISPYDNLYFYIKVEIKMRSNNPCKQGNTVSICRIINNLTCQQKIQLKLRIFLKILRFCKD
jgi:hypothetical protein